VADGVQKSLKDGNAAWVNRQGAIAAGPLVLIAEDSESDIFFLLRAFAAARLKNPVYVVRGGAEALEYLSGVGKYKDREKYPMPGIVFIDLKMPKPDGFDVLRWKEGQMDLPRMLWVAVSNFDGVRTINEAYVAGATTFLAKPLDGMDVRNLVDAFEEYWKVTSATREQVGWETAAGRV
jgi:CheY-like chemotaxis protein